jgi:hypothetical protein
MESEFPNGVIYSVHQFIEVYNVGMDTPQ